MKNKVLSIMNEKGGVGKTTTATTLAYLLSKQGFKTLIIDYDPQANTTMSFGVENYNYLPITMYELMDNVIKNEKRLEKERVFFNKSDYIIPVNEYLDLIPSNSGLSNLETLLLSSIIPETKLKTFIDEIKSDYDYVIIDNKPSLGKDVINAMVASDEIIIPTTADLFSVAGLNELIQHIIYVKNVNTALKISGFLITKLEQNTNLNRLVKEKLEETYGQDFYVFKSTIPKSIKVAEAQYFNKPLYEYSGTKDTSVAKAYLDFVNEYLSLEVSHE